MSSTPGRSSRPASRLFNSLHKKLFRRREIEAARSDLDVGQTVQIVRHLHGNQYEVFYRGAQWQAEAVGSSGANDAQTAVITGKNGNILLIQIN